MTETLRVDAALVRLSFLVQSVYAQVCADQGLTPAQAQLLCLIKDRPRGMTELSSMLRLERPGLSGLVNRIERRELVRRDTAEHDRRAVTLTPTPRGKEVADGFHAEVSRRLLRIVEHLPANDRRQLERIVGKIIFAECVPAVFGSADTAPESAD